MKITIPDSKFPIIRNINDVLKNIEGNKAIINFVNKNGCQVLSYQIQSPETFNNEFALECRGITFDSSGKIIGRPLHKFFNLGENKKNDVNNIKWENVVEIYDKMDGSMITAHRLNNGVHFKSKMSFESDVVKKVNKYLEGHDNIVNFCNELVDDFTPIFEFTSPTNKIVLNYSKTALTLLHIRHIITGAYISLEDPEVSRLLKKYNIEICEKINLEKNEDGSIDPKKLLNILKNDLKNKEGFVIFFKDGDMLKAKGSWYHKLHKVSTFLRVRDVVDLVIDKRVDDVKSALAINDSDISEIEKIEKDVENKILEVRNNILEVHNKYINESDAKIFSDNNKNPYINYIMYLRRGENIDSLNIREIFRKKHLKSYSLDIINTSKYK